MPSPCEILHNRTIQHPDKTSQPVNMERVRNFLLSCKQNQCNQFNKAHGACALSELPPGQEALFRSPSNNEYIPGTIVDRATVLHSYIIEAQGKRYRRTWEHLQSIHIDLPPPAPKSHSQQCIPRPFPKSHLQQCISRPQLKATQIPKPSLYFHFFQDHLPGPTAKPPCCILCPKPPVDAACPNVEDLLLHLSTLTPLPSASVSPENTWTPLAPQLVLTLPVTLEELDAESPLM